MPICENSPRKGVIRGVFPANHLASTDILTTKPKQPTLINI